jgi:hypothetical protein
LVHVTVARDRVREVRVGGREEGGDSGRSIPFSTSEARLAKNLLRSNPIVFEGVAVARTNKRHHHQHGNVEIGTLVLVLVVLSRFGRRSAAVHARSCSCIAIHNCSLALSTVVEVFSTHERLANGATGHNSAVLEAEGREEVLNKARNVFINGISHSSAWKIQLAPESPWAPENRWCEVNEL